MLKPLLLRASLSAAALTVVALAPVEAAAQKETGDRLPKKKDKKFPKKAGPRKELTKAADDEDKPSGKSAAKAAAKAAAKEAAKEAAKADAKRNAAAATAARAAAAAEAEAAKAAEEEKRLAAEAQTHAKHEGQIERLEQIAKATANAELQAVVARLRDKESQRHALVRGGGSQ